MIQNINKNEKDDMRWKYSLRSEEEVCRKPHDHYGKSAINSFMLTWRTKIFFLLFLGIFVGDVTRK